MKVAFMSTFALDANVSLIHSLNKMCDVYFFTEAHNEITNYLNKNELNKTISKGNEVSQLQNFKHLIPLEKTYVIRGTRQLNIFKKISTSNKINKIIDEIKPDFIILDSHLLTYFKTAWKYRNRSLLIVHDPFFHSGENFFIERLQRKFYFSFLTNKMLFNKNQKEEFINYYKLNPKKVFISFLSIYEYLPLYLNDKEEKNSDFNVLFFGRISLYKGVKYLLDAFTEILESGKIANINLVIAGSGTFDFDASVYENYKQIKIINKFLTPKELASLIYQSSVVICPYLDATQSGVVMSAFAFKKPVIATNVGGLPEMITNGKTGIIINPKDSKAIKDSILKLYESPFLLDEMSENIEKEYFFEEKSWDKSANYFMDAITSILRMNKKS
jgi:glycosyltransferase involved in cell wall biosynthesis